MAAMQVPATRLGFARRLAAIAAGGLAVRLLYVLALTPHLRGHGDSSYYHALANLLADGRGFVEPGNGTPTALHPPLFPLLLALPSVLGLDSYLAHRVAVSLMGTGTIIAVGIVARRVAGERAGVMAAALAAASPVLVSADGAVMSETLLGLLVAICALAAYRLIDRPSLGPRVAARLRSAAGRRIRDHSRQPESSDPPSQAARGHASLGRGRDKRRADPERRER